MSLAAGPIMLLLTRELNAVIARYVPSYGWHANPIVHLSATVLIDLKRILDRWDKLDNYPIHSEDQFSPTIVGYHDASATGYCIQVLFKGKVRHEQAIPSQLRLPLSSEEKEESSSYGTPLLENTGK